jgi:hypothetical protein
MSNNRFDRDTLVRAYSALISYLDCCDSSLIYQSPDYARVRDLCGALGLVYKSEWRHVADCPVFARVVREHVHSGYCDCACGGCFEGPIMGHAGISLCDDCESAGCAASDGDSSCSVERCPECDCVECECDMEGAS